MMCSGRVTGTLGHMAVVALPAARVGDGVRVHPRQGPPICGRVASVDRSRAIVAPLGPLQGVAVGDRVESAPDALACILGFGALGRVVGPAGEPLDGGAPLRGNRASIPLATQAVARKAVATPWWTGVRAIDGLLTIGRGARVGVFGAPGAGKTTLLETIARGARGTRSSSASSASAVARPPVGSDARIGARRLSARRPIAAPPNACAPPRSRWRRG